ncbi:MAG: BREX-2 system phosphatase PglZ [Thermoguttaceae bacterium]
MPVPGPTFGQIRAQVANIRRKTDDSRVFGICTSGRWTGQALQRFGDETYYIAQCDSMLAMRAVLQEELPEAAAKVLVTTLPSDQIDSDIRVRVARRKFYPIDNWQIVKELFQARHIDPRVNDHAWMAERLVELAPLQGYSPVTSGVLDAETVWAILLQRQLGMAIARLDLVDLLKWSMDVEGCRRFRESPGEFQQAAKQWIAESAGPAAEAVLECVRVSQQPEALPVGLALSVVYNDRSRGKLDRAAGRMERYVGSARLTETVAKKWSSAATEVVRLHLPDPKLRSEWLQRADQILEAVEAIEHAYLSTTSSRGFDQRLGQYGEALKEALSGPITAVPPSVQESYRAVIEHEQARWQWQTRRLERVEMSARLIRWLARQDEVRPADPSSFAEASQHYALRGSFVDWARNTLLGGEPVRELADAYAQLLAQVREIRERQNEQFAKLLRDWIAAGSRPDGIIPIERVLDEVVAPLAGHAPVLVLVIDGMSFAVFREMIEDLTRQDWAEIRPEEHAPAWPGIVALPSVTEVCRTSLLCGRLCQGQANIEKNGFAEHPGLVRACRNGEPPILFHKDALQAGGDMTLAAGVIQEIEAPRRRIVGVVINAVDDHLLRGDQLDVRWTGEEIKVLPLLLHEARVAGRLVILLTDHGHVLDCQTQQQKHDSSDRWRPSDGAIIEGEIVIAGERVVLPADHQLIAPWSEKIRYGVKKNGYHGGVTMQEAVVPVAVLSARDDLPPGWHEPPVDAPDWWFAPLEEHVQVAVEPHVPPKRPPKKRPAGMLFNTEREESPAEATAAVPPGPTTPAWLDALFRSPVFADQQRLGGRIPPTDESIRKLLQALHEQGGKLTWAALAVKLQQPAFRLTSLLAAIQRILNVEGYPILTRDEASDTVQFNRELLCRQFDLS